VGLIVKEKAGGGLGYNLYKCGIAKGHENFDIIGIIGGHQRRPHDSRRAGLQESPGRARLASEDVYITGGAPLKPVLQK
jgi:hypothetical protein